jgi:hypothetical protein
MQSAPHLPAGGPRRHAPTVTAPARAGRAVLPRRASLTQGGAVPDVKVLDFKRSELRERFDDLYRVLNPKAAAVARQAKIDKLRGPAPH